MVPLFVLWGGYGQRDAHAVSLGAIIPISAAGVLVFGAAGEIRLWEALALAAGSIVGAQAGAGCWRAQTSGSSSSPSARSC